MKNKHNIEFNRLLQARLFAELNKVKPKKRFTMPSFTNVVIGCTVFLLIVMWICSLM